MVDHQPVTISENKKICCRCQRRVEARFIEDRDVFCAGYPGKIPHRLYPHIGRSRAQFLSTLKNHLPAFAHPTPSGQQIPPGVYAPHPVFVGPHLVHPLKHSGFERPIKGCIRLFDGDCVVSAHKRARLYCSPPEFKPVESRSAENLLTWRWIDKAEVWTFSLRFPPTQLVTGVWTFSLPNPTHASCWIVHTRPTKRAGARVLNPTNAESV